MPDLPASFVDAIRDRYEIEREIGQGGMATVHLARDVRHGREVAVKVLKPEFAAEVGAERFLKEIEIAARLTHPHIIPLHDSGQAAGFLYYVMPFIDGESLRARLLRDAPLDVRVALEIASRVGDALAYAHRQGVLHRDIKPENILFAAGHPMVADFGIARALHTAGGERFTRTGMALGTPGYMSPEQLAGEREVDERADLYSLACVLYEMLIGEPPGMWQTDPRALESGRFVDLPERHRVGVRRIGRPLERSLVRALAMNPKDRFDSVDAFIVTLRATGRPTRRYDDGEVRAIVRRAAEEELANPTSQGLSLDTVQQIAEEVGISADRVERAARELEPRPTGTPADPGSVAFWLGSPVTLSTERTVAAETKEAAYEEMVDEIEATLAAEGTVDVRSSSLTWRAADPKLGKQRAVQIRVTSRDGRTRIRAQERLGELAASLFPSITVGAGVPVLAVLLSVAGPEFGYVLTGSLGVGWVAGMHAIARAVFRGVARGKREDLDELTDRLAEIAADSARRDGTAGDPPRALPG